MVRRTLMARGPPSGTSRGLRSSTPRSSSAGRDSRLLMPPTLGGTDEPRVESRGPPGLPGGLGTDRVPLVDGPGDQGRRVDVTTPASLVGPRVGCCPRPPVRSSASTPDAAGLPAPFRRLRRHPQPAPRYGTARRSPVDPASSEDRGSAAAGLLVTSSRP